MQVSFNIPDSVVTELTLVAQAEGFASAKALVIHWLLAKVKAYREQKALSAALETVKTADVVIT